jgi:monoamine oxidase
VRPAADPLPRFEGARRPRAVVCGAGVAGLVAARDLEAVGVAVVAVLEARAEPGGRVRTFRLEDGAHAEAGADLFEEGHDALYALAKDLGLRTVSILRGGFSFRRADGRAERGGWSAVAAAVRPFEAVLDAVGRTWRSAVEASLARVSLSDWLRAARAPAALARRCESLARGFFLCDPERLAFLSFADEMTGGEGGGPFGPFRRIAGGNDRLVAALARSLRAPLRTGFVVERVEQTARGVGVLAREARTGRTERFDADVAVVTLPPPPLARVAFTPPLPPERRRAVETTRLGPVVKGVVRLARPAPFGRGPRAFGTDAPFGAAWDAGEGQRGRPPILTVHAGGDLASRWEGLRGDRLAAALEAPLARALRARRSLRVLEAQAVAWHREPFTGGGYAVLETSDDPSLRASLSRPHGRVLFAGEHTSREFPGYVNGAVESGRRAALEARALLGRRPGAP